MANILDVAAKAGVSRSTVSRVINNSERVDAETRKNVLQAMKDLNYQPSRVAQSLRNQKTYLIAVLVPRLSNPFYARLMQGIESQALAHGYHIILCNTGFDPDKEFEYLKLLEHAQVDGIIITAFRSSLETVQSFKKFGPIVLVGEYLDNDLFPTVTVDYQKAAYAATEHLLKLGHRQIGLAVGSLDSVINRDREMGYRKALADYGVPVSEDWIRASAVGLDEGRQFLRSLLSSRGLPTAVFAASDELAVGIIQEAKKQNIAVPVELAVVGFDDLPIASIVEPQLTTIAQPTEEIGVRSMSLLLDCLKGKSITERRIILETQLTIRDSCGSRYEEEASLVRYEQQ
ncbi:Catabolite control protein A [compost metagenome]